jgi:hypothetical protein
MIVPGGEQHGRRIAAHGEQAGVPQRCQARIADQDVECEGENCPDQDLAGNVDVIGVADPNRQRRERHKDESDGGALGRKPTHDTTLPNKPCGRSTRIISIGRNKMT